MTKKRVNDASPKPKTRARRGALQALDPETRLTDDHHNSLRLWLRLLTCVGMIEASIRRRLMETFATTLPRFDLMAQLERAPDGLKMSELSRRMMVTGGNVTGIADLLERQKMIVRRQDADDRRALRVKLTPAGVRAFRAMAVEHERWVIELLQQLSPGEKAQLTRLLGRLKRQVADSAQCAN